MKTKSFDAALREESERIARQKRESESKHTLLASRSKPYEKLHEVLDGAKRFVFPTDTIASGRDPINVVAKLYFQIGQAFSKCPDLIKEYKQYPVTNYWPGQSAIQLIDEQVFQYCFSRDATLEESRRRLDKIQKLHDIGRSSRVFFRQLIDNLTPELSAVMNIGGVEGKTAQRIKYKWRSLSRNEETDWNKFSKRQKQIVITINKHNCDNHETMARKALLSSIAGKCSNGDVYDAKTIDNNLGILKKRRIIQNDRGKYWIVRRPKNAPSEIHPFERLADGKLKGAGGTV